MIKQQQLKQTKPHYSLQTKSLILRPYSRAYVPQYHTWFTKYPQLLHLTGSQPLTIQQQLQNHKSWLEDPTKYTFIIFTKENQSQKQKMIGDVNLFFSQWIEPNQAQINIMIAVPQYRGKGYSKEVMAVIQLFAYAIYKRDKIIAKIKYENISSIKFFQKIGYIFIQDNPRYQQKQYHKTNTFNNQQSLKQLKQIYKLKEITNIESLYN